MFRVEVVTYQKGEVYWSDVPWSEGVVPESLISSWEPCCEMLMDGGKDAGLILFMIVARRPWGWPQRWVGS